MIEQIIQEGEEYEDKEMLSVYKEQSKALDEINSFIGALFMKYAINGLLQLNSSQNSQIKAQAGKILKDTANNLSKDENSKLESILKTVYTDTYYKNAFAIDCGIKMELKFDILKKEFIEAAINQKFKGELFSDRIWKNKADMIDKLQKSIAEAMKGNTTIDKIAKDIKDTFNVKAFESQRLARTETARIQTQASYDIGKSAGVTKVMWSATLDNSTNPEDAELDGKTWGIDEEHPEPPLHPNCRCCLINMPTEDWKPTQRKDNETKELIDNTTYEEWAKSKGIQ